MKDISLNLSYPLLQRGITGEFKIKILIFEMP